MARCRCRFPEGIDIKPNGVNSLIPCKFKEKEVHTNVNVSIIQCERCGRILVEWFRTDQTEDIIYEPLEEEPEDD